MKKNLEIYLEKFFPFLILIISAIAFYQPNLFLWIKPYIPFLLGMVMVSIGLTIDAVSLKINFLRYRTLPFLVIIKFLFLAFLGFAIGKLLNLPSEIIIGLVIVGSCPGGVSANVMSYLSKANTALAVILTILTTLLCPIIMPAIIYLLLHKIIVIPFADIASKLFWVVAFPLLDGLILRRFFLQKIEKISWILPPFSIINILLIIGCVAASNRQVLMDDPWKIAALVLLMNLAGYAAGYWLGKFLKCDEPSNKAISFEFGMQDSSIGIMLATTFFSPLSALPSALFSIIQNVTGPVLVNFFKRDTTKKSPLTY
jgi:BASS family bile acid:Na+ symporter